MGAVLGRQQYGKAEIRLVYVDRSSDRHVLRDLTVTTVLRGDFAAAHVHGDNARILTTDAQKNTVYAFAREHGIGAIDDYAMRLARHFAGAYPWISGASVSVDEHPWTRLTVAGAEHDHAFARGSDECRTVVATVNCTDHGIDHGTDHGTDYVAEEHLVSGLSGLVLLKTSGSEFTGFPRDTYTTLPETTDRILATAVTARWRSASAAVAPSYETIRAALVETFASLHSLALQQTLYEMGDAALTACPDIEEIRLSLPNKHHFVVDLSPFGLDNPNVVFHADDRPYGKIEAAVLREGAVAAPAAWDAIGGFC